MRRTVIAGNFCRSFWRGAPGQSSLGKGGEQERGTEGRATGISASAGLQPLRARGDSDDAEEEEDHAHHRPQIGVLQVLSAMAMTRLSSAGNFASTLSATMLLSAARPAEAVGGGVQPTWIHTTLLPTLIRYGLLCPRSSPASLIYASTFEKGRRVSQSSGGGCSEGGHTRGKREKRQREGGDRS